MNYHAVTLGPIYQTFRHARRTREVWAASYLFSYLAKGIIIRTCLDDFTGKNYSVLTDSEKTTLLQKSPQFVLPNINEPQLFEPRTGVGLFPDRIIFKSELLAGRDFQEIIDMVLNDIASLIDPSEDPENKTFDFLKTYFRIDWGTYNVVEGKNAILAITPYLDALELAPQFVSKESSNPLLTFLSDAVKNGFLTEHYKEQDINRNVRFESLVEIATRGIQTEPVYINNFNKFNWRNPKNLKVEEEDKSEADFMEILSQDRKVFKSYHKYICIVKADGDKIGKTLQKIQGQKLVDFSKKLLDWGLAAKDIIRKFGAIPIYVGGDDLLFFSPVSTTEGTIIDLLEAIDKAFNDQKWEDISTEVSPSLSYGVSMTYYKYPLGEAMQKADSLLYDAKQAGGNAIALKFLKHSGNEFEVILPKSDPLYHKHFKTLLNRMVDDKAFLNSVGFKLRENQALLKTMAGDKQRMENLFHEIFDERLENRETTDEYLKEIRELFTYSFKKQNKEPIKEQMDRTMKEVFSLIRTSKFIKGLEEVKD